MYISSLRSECLRCLDELLHSLVNLFYALATRTCQTRSRVRNTGRGVCMHCRTTQTFSKFPKSLLKFLLHQPSIASAGASEATDKPQAPAAHPSLSRSLPLSLSLSRSLSLSPLSLSQSVSLSLSPVRGAEAVQPYPLCERKPAVLWLSVSLSWEGPRGENVGLLWPDWSKDD